MAHPAQYGGLRDQVAEALTTFSTAIRAKLAGPGQREDQLRAPLENLLTTVAAAFNLPLVAYGEVPLRELKVRLDYAVNAGGVICGYVEVKEPSKRIDPTSWSPKSHDRRQWEKLRQLPNLLYTNGDEWALYRFGERVGAVARVQATRNRRASVVVPEDGELLRVLVDFLQWLPTPPKSLNSLVDNVARLCRLLRDEVDDALARERRGDAESRYRELVDDWRELLFPGLDDRGFADAYAQTVTFALLLARIESIDFQARTVGEIALLLAKSHSHMGKALQALTEPWTLGGVAVALDTLVRVVGALDWDLIDDGTGEAYRLLYERFLEVYDPALRRRTGSYYTPDPVAAAMVNFVDEVLQERLGVADGFAARDLITVDPAMGTGTFLLHVIDAVARRVATEDPAYMAQRLRELSTRLVGFEQQTGPYAVAELKVSSAIHKKYNTDPPTEGMRLYVADTLDDPFLDEERLDGWGIPQRRSKGTMYEPIERSRREANKLKTRERVTVVIGNPPYGDKAKGRGGWVEKGTGQKPQLRPVPMEAFRSPGLGRLEYVLSNMYVYFWRWATWKVFDAHRDAPCGIVAFITPSGYTTGPGFGGMREYLRRTADEGWIIDLTPEGHQPRVNSRVFAGVQQPICIGIFARYGESNPNVPALIHHRSIIGEREEKFRQLGELHVDQDAWTLCTKEWRAPFRPESTSQWSSCPTLADLLPWFSPGVKPNRTWVYAPQKETLRRRWRRIVSSPAEERRELLKETWDRSVDSVVADLAPGAGQLPSLRNASGAPSEPVRVGFRSFDRQWLLLDNRVVDRPRSGLWASQGRLQIYLTEPRSDSVRGGPAVTFTAHVPDMHHYRGHHGGVVRPLYRDQSGQQLNVARGLIPALATRLGIRLDGKDLFAYIAGVAANSGFSEHFSDFLDGIEVRLPLTASPEKFLSAVALGRRVLWLHTYGERFADTQAKKRGAPRLADDLRPRIIAAIPDDVTGMPTSFSYSKDTGTLNVGTGALRPVPQAVWDYHVSGMPVVKKWLGYRIKDPKGQRSSPLDHDNALAWPPHLTDELLDLLNVLGLLVELELEQTDLLKRIVEGPLITVEELMTAGVIPPAPASRSAPKRGTQDPLVP